MKKSLLIISLLLSCLVASAQRFSSLVPDTAITNFMKWLLKSDTAFKAVRDVDNDIRRLSAENFAYPGSSTVRDYGFTKNIFDKENGLSAWITREDADYFTRQILHQRDDKWRLRIKDIRLLDTVEIADNRLRKVLYSYSLPLFSIDKKYVIIVEAFFCGLVCGGGEYNLYERQADNSWKKIQQFNKWAE